MKVYIPEYRKNSFFSPIRSQYDVLKVYAKILELLLYPHETSQFSQGSTIFMEILKTRRSRVFFFSEKKIFSIFFPFQLEDDGAVKMEEIKIDSTALASINEFVSKLNDSNHKEPVDFTDFFCMVDDLDNKHEGIYSILHALLMQESGYIRYDFDKKYENGVIHPLYHFDVGYSNAVTYKIGLYDSCNIEDFKNFLVPENETSCKFIEAKK